MTYDPRTVSAPAAGLRLLPWATPDGRPCYLSTDSATGVLSLIADDVEDAQIDTATDVLHGARAVLDDAKAGEHAVRFALRRTVESLGDTLRIADSRGARLPLPDDDGTGPTARGGTTR